MTPVLGALLAGAAVAFAFAAVAMRPRTVARRLALFQAARGRTARWRAVRDDDLRQSGLGWSQEQLVASKVASALGLGALGAAASLVLAIGPLVTLALAYGGFIAPSLLVERAARSRRAAADTSFAAFVERAEALITSGRPAESAIATLALRPSGSELLDDVLRSSGEAASLGAPLFRALSARAGEAGLPAARTFADDLDRSRGLGRGSMAVVADTRAALRSRERARSLDAASRVEGKLMLVLVFCYLPALMLLVVVPLFIGLLDGLAM